MQIPAWLNRFPITGTWAEHIARGSPGGVDFGAPAGTNIYSPSGGLLTFFEFPDGSSVLRIKRDDGTRTEFLHGHLIGKQRRVHENEYIGESDGRPGHDGAGPSDGAHIHAHDVDKNGKRVYPFSTIASTPAGGGGITPITEEESLDMPRYIWTNNAGIGYALIDSNYTDGIIVTADINVANQFSWLVSYPPQNGAPQKVERVLFNKMCASAIALWRGYAYKGGDFKLTDEQIAKIADMIPDANTDDIVEALNSGFASADAQADAYQEALLAEISNVDEETLATFGLKRI